MKMETWLIFTILTIFFAAIATNTQRYVMGKLKIDTYFSIFLFQFIAGIFFLTLWLLNDGQFSEYKILPDYIPNLLFIIIFYSTTNICYFNALRHIESAKFSIIASTSSLFVIIFSSIFLNKSILLHQIGGVIIVFVGIIILNHQLLNRNSLKNIFKVGIGELLTILGAISLGAAITNDGFMISKMNLYLYAGIAFLLPSLFVPFIFPKSFNNLQNIRDFFRINTFKWFALYMFSYILQAFTFYMALNYSGNPALVASITLSSVIFTGLGAYVFLKERSDFWIRLLSAIITIAGLLIITN